MMTHWWHDRLVDDYFDGRLRVRAESRLRARIGRCASCRARYRRHLVVEAAMPGGDERALERLWQGIAAAGGIATPRPAPAPRSRARRLAIWGALAAAAIAVIAVRLPSRDLGRSTAAPVARGGATDLTGAPVIHVFRSVSDHAAEPIGAGIHARDGLLFAYTNPDPQLRYLMIFAVAQTDTQAIAVHWYYPAYRRLGEDPEAVSILPGTTGIELGEEIRQALRPGAVRIYALFLREPHRVLEIESIVRQIIEEPRRPVTEETRLPLAGSVQSSLLVQVTP